jgi:hypothetical protein
MRYVLATALLALSFVIFQAAAKQKKHECEDKPGIAHKVDCLIEHVATLENPKSAIKQSTIGCVKSGDSGLCAIIDETGSVTFFDATGGVQGHYKMEGMTVPVNVSCFDDPNPAIQEAELSKSAKSKIKYQTYSGSGGEVAANGFFCVCGDPLNSVFGIIHLGRAMNAGQLGDVGLVRGEQIRRVCSAWSLPKLTIQSGEDMLITSCAVQSVFSDPWRLREA